jgi:two-component system, LytTR family, sensor kinase
MLTKAKLTQKNFPWQMRKWQLSAILTFYFFFGLLYWLAYYIQGSNRWKEMIIDYTGKAIITVPFWYLFFRLLKTKSMKFKLTLHFITWPAFVALWFFTNRTLLDLFNGKYLSGAEMIWDIYIPSLFYFLQFAIFHVYDYWQKHQQQMAAQKMLTELAYQSEINALKAQIQPHFLFNTLNSISASVPPQLEKTRELIAKLADTFRYSLQASQTEWISLEKELSFISTYMALEKERFKERVTFACNIEESLLQVQIPPMLLQPIVENAIKHGIAPNAAGGDINIVIMQKNGKVNISIADTGIGYNGIPGDEIFNKGIGLRNTRARLDKLYGESLLIEPNSPYGLKLSFNIPLTNSYANKKSNHL